MNKVSEMFALSHGKYNGYCLFKHENELEFRVYDIDFEVESLVVTMEGLSKQKQPFITDLETINIDSLLEQLKEEYAFVKKIEKQMRWSDLADIIDYHIPERLSRNKVHLAVWLNERMKKIDAGLYENEEDVMEYYIFQNKLKKKVITNNELTKNPKYIAGADVAYNESKQKMVGAIVVLDANTLEVVEESWHAMEITFPYIPGLFSFREIPPLLEAYRKLKIKPDLIICDGHGIAHPKGVGMATHLGIELDVPTIGCAKKRLVGAYKKETLEKERGSMQSLIWDDREVGVALRTQIGINPVFVSIGHRIDLKTAINWVLKLCSKYRLPETTRQADKLVNTLMKERNEFDIFGDEFDEIG
ncbi:MAG: deoxyribonuclease V [Halioglobus sp.]|jgi:deoxyribonuclease V